MASDKERQADVNLTKTDATASSVSSPSSQNEIDAFLQQAAVLKATKAPGAKRGRLLFAMDATMSRQPTWDMACQLQAEMFQAADSVGGLDVQLIYFRGFGECRSSKWVSDGASLANLMGKIQCRGGATQIGRVLKHAINETTKEQVSAVVLVGDAMEENIDALCQAAGELGLRKVPVFAFQEGRIGVAETAFREIARLSGGAYCRFDSGSADQLRSLLSAVAVYASGGHAALADHSRKSGGNAQLLLSQLKQ